MNPLLPRATSHHKSLPPTHPAPSFAEHQKKAEDRAVEMAGMTRGNDARVSELEREKSELLNQLSDLKAKTTIGESEVAALREQLREAKAELEAKTAEWKELSDSQGTVAQKYENERALKVGECHFSSSHRECK